MLVEIGIKETPVNLVLTTLVNRRVRAITRGHTLKGSPVPPTFNVQPWNGLTVMDKLVISNQYWIKNDRIVILAASQAGLYYQSDSSKYERIALEFRILKIKVWNLSDKSFLKLMPMDFLFFFSRVD